ncbi:MAG: hypothetical protein ACI9U2_003884 [Bradymonadia bacterium]|jgi:hypothetical protein
MLRLLPDSIRRAALPLLSLAVLSLTVLALGGCKADPFVVHVTFPEAAGLKPGDNVAMRGLAIGQVLGIDIDGAGVKVSLEVAPKYQSHLDDKALFSIEEEKLVTGKRRVAVVPGAGDALLSGATVAGHALPTDMINRAEGALKRSVDHAESALDRTVAQAENTAKSLGKAVLNPDTLPPRTAGGTIDLDQPRHFKVRLLSVHAHPTSADGKDWDSMGDPELIAQVWVGDRQVLLVEGKDALKQDFDSALSEPFDLTDKTVIRVKILDKDVGYNDEIGVISLQPTLADAKAERVFRLAAGRVAELRLTIETFDPTAAPPEAPASDGPATQKPGD